MAEYDELGQLIQGPQAPQGGGWTAALSDPVNRAAMLATGLKLMTGGWGNGTQQLASALGAGASAAGATAESLMKEEQYQDKLDEQEKDRSSRERQAELNRDSRADIAGIQNAGRLEVAQERVRGSLERARMMKQPSGQAETKFYQEQLKEARKTIEGDIGSLKLDQPQREDMIRAKALERLDEARRQGLFGPQGEATIDQRITPQRPGAAAPEAGAGTVKPTATPITLEQLIKDPVAGPRAQEDLKTPEGRARIRAKFPDLGNELYRYEANQGIKGDWFSRGR